MPANATIESNIIAPGCTIASGSWPAIRCPKPCRLACSRRVSARIGTSGAANRSAAAASVLNCSTMNFEPNSSAMATTSESRDGELQTATPQPIQQVEAPGRMQCGNLAHQQPIETDRCRYDADREAGHHQCVTSVGVWRQQAREHQQAAKRDARSCDADDESPGGFGSHLADSLAQEGRNPAERHEFTAAPASRDTSARSR